MLLPYLAQFIILAKSDPQFPSPTTLLPTQSWTWDRIGHPYSRANEEEALKLMSRVLEMLLLSMRDMAPSDKDDVVCYVLARLGSSGTTRRRRFDVLVSSQDRLLLRKPCVLLFWLL